MKFNINNNQYILPTIILGIALIISTIIGGFVFNSVKSASNTLVVTGSAKESVKADKAIWTISTNAVVFTSEVPGAYSTVSDNTRKIKDYLLKNGIGEDQIDLSTIYADEYWSGQNTVRQMNVHQNIIINSNDVEKIKALSGSISSLANQGVIFSPSAPQYFVSKLPELRVSLLGQAVNDAKARAQEIVKYTDRSVGRMKSASSGVVQVMQTNSTNVSDYGEYDTSTIDKDVMVTVKVTFIVN